MQQLVNHFSKHNFGDQYINSDILGDAYEYLIEQFAAGAGKKGGEFYTPREIERLIMHILNPHEKDHIYDPTVGSGGFLLEAFHHVRDKYNEAKARSLYLYGQEFNMSTFTIARINMFLHGLDSADIRMGDTLANPQFLTNENQLQTFDICVSNFPYSVKEWAREKFATNSFGRLDGYEMPPDKNADYAFILHIIKSLNENGKAGIVVPHGTLFKTDASGRIREQILKNDLIEAVIALPSKLFYGVGIPVAVIILNKNKPEERKNKVLIIDAEKEYQEGKNQNRLRAKDIEKTSNAFHAFKDIEKFARVVDLKEIEENEFNLNIRRYVDTSEEEENIDTAAAANEMRVLEDVCDGLNRRLDGYLEELKISQTKEFTNEEFLFVERTANKILEPINGNIDIKREPVIINWSSSDSLGLNQTKQKSFRYKILIKSDLGEFDYTDSFFQGVDLARIAWKIAWKVFSRLDGDHRSLLSENLWPMANGHLPDYDKFTDKV